MATTLTVSLVPARDRAINSSTSPSSGANPSTQMTAARGHGIPCSVCKK